MEHRHEYADNSTDHAPGAHPVVNCDGTEVWRTYGTWKGHVGPGTTFLVWGAWWTVWVLWRYVRRGAKRFEARPWYGPSLGGRVLPMEPLVKLVGPLIITYIELYGDHDEFRQDAHTATEQTQTLTCKDGRFAMTHMNNWQHASVYPAFLLAAALDWGAMVVPLPPGMQQAALSFAFFVEGFLMANHKKHEPLDQTVHQLLVVAIFGAAASLVAELWRPRSLLAALGRGFFAMLQGAWLIQIGRIMWGGDSRWDLDYAGSVMMPPVYFVWIAVTIAACICACYMAIHLLAQHLPSRQYSLLPQTQLNMTKAAGARGKGAKLNGLLGGLFSQQTLAVTDKLAAEDAAESADATAASRGSSFSGGLLPEGGVRRQGSMHMRSDSANNVSVAASLGSTASIDSVGDCGSIDGDGIGSSSHGSPWSGDAGVGLLVAGRSPFSAATAHTRQQDRAHALGASH